MALLCSASAVQSRLTNGAHIAGPGVGSLEGEMGSLGGATTDGAQARPGSRANESAATGGNWNDGPRLVDAVSEDVAMTAPARAL